MRRGRDSTVTFRRTPTVPENADKYSLATRIAEEFIEARGKLERPALETEDVEPLLSTPL